MLAITQKIIERRRVNAKPTLLYFVLRTLYFDVSPSSVVRQSTKLEAQRTNALSAEDYNPFPEPVVIEITDVFDLHTIPPRQVKAVFEEYLREAHAKGLPLVRIIHGKGRFVQREIVHNVLARTDFVLDWTDAPPDAGGLGATIVRLKQFADYADSTD